MATDIVMSGTDDFEMPARKRPKISELPLSGAQHSAIDQMLHTFKKKGEFDALRKKAFQQYNESANRGMFENALRTFTHNEIERESVKYLRPDRRIAAPLLEGAASRAEVYAKTEDDINAYIDQFMVYAEATLREIRRKDIGDEAADEEIRKGSKSDAEYAAEAEQRKHDRAKKHAEDERLRKKKEAQEKKKKELEMLKKKQEALMKETERLQREQKRRAEREAWKNAEKERERERIKQFNEEREKQKKEAEEREKALQEERDRRQRERAEREQKRLEAEALEALLKEGEVMAEKARRPELERSESMEPPTRLQRHSSAAKTNQAKENMRAQGLVPTSLTLRKTDSKPSAASPPSSAPTGPARDRERARERERMREREDSRSYRPPPRSRSPPRSPARSTRRRDPTPEDRRPKVDTRDRRESLLRDISAERDAWKSRQRGGRDDRDRDREREREGAEERERDRERVRDRRREDDRDEGEVVERFARRRTRSPEGPDIWRPAARRDESRSPPPRRRERSRSRSRDRRRDRERERERDRSRSRSRVGIDRYIPGGGDTARRPREDDAEADRRRSKDDGADAPSKETRADDARERSLPRRRAREDEDGKEMPRERDRKRDQDTDKERDRATNDRLNSIIRDERDKPRRRARYDDRGDIDRWVPSGGTRGEDDRPRRRERSRSRDRDRSRERLRERERRDSRDRRLDSRDKRPDSRDRRPSKSTPAKEGEPCAK